MGVEKIESEEDYETLRHYIQELDDSDLYKQQATIKRVLTPALKNIPQLDPKSYHRQGLFQTMTVIQTKLNNFKSPSSQICDLLQNFVQLYERLSGRKLEKSSKNQNENQKT